MWFDPGFTEVVNAVILIIAVVAGGIQGHRVAFKASKRCDDHEREIRRLRRMVVDQDRTLAQFNVPYSPDKDPAISDHPGPWSTDDFPF